nr:hypothetical protein [uncultured Roseateles sp.]
MKHSIALFLAASAALMVGPVLAQTQVGVSIGINQPGVYGRINIGNAPPPMVVYEQPVIYAPTRVAVHQQPIYLYVPPGHQRDWGRYCGRYSACGQPVYFVQERWIQERASQAREERGRGHGRGDKGHDRRDDERGHGGKGHKDRD